MSRGPRSPNEGLTTPIFINGRFLTQRITGVQRYASELVQALDAVLADDPQLNRELQVVLVAPPGARVPELKAIEFRSVGPLKGNAWEQIVLPWVTRGALLMNFNATGPLIKANQIITIHDTSVYAVPDAFTWTFRTWYHILLSVLVKRCRLIATVSHFSKSEILSYLQCDEKKIRVGVEGWEHIRRVAPDIAILKKNGLKTKDYVLAVSSPTKNKNFKLIAEALNELGETDFDIVIAGGADGRVFLGGTHLPKHSRIKHVGYVTDAQLRSLYENAALFVYPSLYEGFGLPALEAMASGCPVVGSTAAAIVEVCGPAARYVSPDDAKGLADLLRVLMSDAAQREQLSAAGKTRLERFSWKAAAITNLSWIREVALGALSADSAASPLMNRESSTPPLRW